MSENTQNQNNENQTEAKEKKPRVVKHRDVRIEELREDIKALEAKLAQLLADKAAEEQVESLGEGDLVSFTYGRKTDTTEPQTLSGRIIAKAKNERGLVQFNVLTGEGINTRTLLIAASAILVTENGEGNQGTDRDN